MFCILSIELNADITLSEVEDVLKNLKNNKSPGIDGLISYHYMAVRFWDESEKVHRKFCKYV